MPRAPAQKWVFAPRFRRHAFGWRSQPAVQRVKEATTEIQKVAKKDPALAAAGAVIFLEKVSPALFDAWWLMDHFLTALVGRLAGRFRVVGAVLVDGKGR